MSEAPKGGCIAPSQVFWQIEKIPKNDKDLIVWFRFEARKRKGKWQKGMLVTGLSKLGDNPCQYP
jgi:hypothetical protein